MLIEGLKDRLTAVKESASWITVLTGAGISAESGIPTFRGPEGYWTIGSRDYYPQEMATRRMFLKQPYEVWKWYLYRIGVCRQSRPNRGHLALAKLEEQLPTRFKLITQNVDDLHLQAGSSPSNMYQIHGNIYFGRCLQECDGMVHELPGSLVGKTRDEDLAQSERELLVCPSCGGLLRPHVLWFDETYNELHYRSQSALAAADRAALLLTVGSSGTTNLPSQVAWRAYQNQATIIDVNIERNPFSDLAEKSPQGAFLQGPSASLLPAITAAILEG